MGFLDKVKNMFTEEIDDDDEENVKPSKSDDYEVKAEVRHVPIESPLAKDEEDDIPLTREDIEKINNYTDKYNENLAKTKENFDRIDAYQTQEMQPKKETKKPIFFTDQDFDDIDSYTPKRAETNSKTNTKNTTEVKAIYKDPVVEQPKRFTPTPIISPVYGVLDKNYKKEDIVNKQKKTYRVADGLTIDSVREKAFGSLENDLEKTLYSSGLEDEFPVKKSRIDDDIFNQTDIYSEQEKQEVLEKEDTIKELENISYNIDQELDNLITKKSSIKRRKNTLNNSVEKDNKDDKNESDDDINEIDLFNLIDSMYDERS